MRRFLTFLCLLLAIAAPLGAAESHVFARAYDLNTPTIAATTNYIVTSVNLTNTTFVLAHQPDVPRNVTVTVTDTTPSVTAGTITVTGTDVNGATQTEVFDLSTALTFTGTKVFKTIASVVSANAATLGGSGDETIIVGVGSVVSYIYCASTDPIQSQARVQTSGSSSTVTTVGGVQAFGGMTIGDEIFAQVDQTLVRHTVTAIASSSSITIDSAVSWGNSGKGYPFQWRHTLCGYSDSDGWKVSASLAAPNVKVEIGDGSGAALTAVGGVDVSVECRISNDETGLPVQVIGVNLTSTLRPTNTLLVPVAETCSAIRVGFKFGTNDTSGTDSVSAYLVGGAFPGSR